MKCKVFHYPPTQANNAIYGRPLIENYLRTTDSNITGLPHVIAAVEPSKEIPCIADYKYSRGDAVDSNDMTVAGNRQTRYNVNVANGNFLDEMPILREYLHSRSLVAPVADDEFSAVPHDRYFSRVPQLALFLAGNSELKLENASFLEYLRHKS